MTITEKIAGTKYISPSEVKPDKFSKTSGCVFIFPYSYDARLFRGNWVLTGNYYPKFGLNLGVKP